MFSTEATTETVEDLKNEFDDISEPEKQKYRDAWGLKFDDECIKFEKEWEKIAEDKENKQKMYIDEVLDENQKRRIDFLVKKTLELNMDELRYLTLAMKDRVQKTSGMNPMKLNMDWPSIKMDTDGTWPPLNPNWFKQQELMAQVAPFMGLGGGQGGQGGGAAQPQEAAEEEEEKEEPKEEVVKTNFDLELSGFDAKSKIKLIKEIRSSLGLGLKEAKEMVESAPIWIKKGMNKEDCDALIAKLEPLGAQLKVV
jgi:large subunit ribosomal protein L7/L12